MIVRRLLISCRRLLSNNPLLSLKNEKKNLPLKLTNQYDAKDIRQADVTNAGCNERETLKYSYI